MNRFNRTELQGKRGRSLYHFIHISQGSSSTWHLQEQDHTCVVSGELFLPRPHSSSCAEEQLIHTLQIFAEKRSFEKPQKGKNCSRFITLFLSNWKLAGETASCSFMQFKEEVDYLLICFRLHKTVFLIQGCNTGCKDESCAHRLTDDQ